MVRLGPWSGSAIGKFDRACHVFHPCSLHPAGRLGCIFSPHRCRSVSKLKVYLVMSATLAAAGQKLHCERHQSRSLQVTYAPPNVDMATATAAKQPDQYMDMVNGRATASRRAQRNTHRSLHAGSKGSLRHRIAAGHK